VIEKESSRAITQSKSWLDDSAENVSLLITGLDSMNIIDKMIKVRINKSSISSSRTFFKESTFKIFKNLILLKCIVLKFRLKNK